jgi:uncharacterized protein YegL
MNDKMEIVCILDKSGSMEGLAKDTIGGFNTYLDEIKKIKKDVTFSLILFDTKYDYIYKQKSLKDVDPIDDKVYRASGMTALLDAVGRAIDDVEKRHKDLGKKKPDTVVFFIATDGEENSSVEYHADQIKKMVKEKTDEEKWTFIFSGANIDAFQTGGNYGFMAKTTNNYVASAVGTRALYKSVATNMMDLADGLELHDGQASYDAAYKEEEAKAQKK